MNNDTTLQERNAEICAKYCQLSEQQPLASSNRIIRDLAMTYGLTEAGVRHILKGAGIATSRPIEHTTTPQHAEQ